MLQPTELERVGVVKNILTSDIKMKNLEVFLLVFSLGLILYFLTMLLFPSFRNGKVYVVPLYVGRILSVLLF